MTGRERRTVRRRGVKGGTLQPYTPLMTFLLVVSVKTCSIGTFIPIFMSDKDFTMHKNRLDNLETIIVQKFKNYR